MIQAVPRISHAHMKFQPSVLAFLVLILTVLLLAGCSEEEEVEEPGVQVPVADVALESVILDRTYTGRSRGAREVEIRVRVDGILLEREYSEGAMVDEGQALFRIDPGPYQVRVQSAQANLDRADAEARQAEREWERVVDLYEDDAASGRERDEAQSRLELAMAEVAMAEAALAEARIDLDFTRITSPLRGVAGRETQPTGSLVSAGNLLTTVTQLDPIHIEFSIPEAHMVTFGDQIRLGLDVAVFLHTRDGSLYRYPGRIDFAESSIDETTGTLQARAVFNNPGHSLLPGQFVRITLAGLRAGEGFLVPVKAVVDLDSEEPHVWVVGDDNRVQRQPIQIDREVGDDVVVVDGLTDGMRIVVDGASGLESGDLVDPEDMDQKRRPVPILPFVPMPEQPPELVEATLPRLLTPGFWLYLPFAPDIPILVGSGLVPMNGNGSED